MVLIIHEKLSSTSNIFCCRMRNDIDLAPPGISYRVRNDGGLAQPGPSSGFRTGYHIPKMGRNSHQPYPVSERGRGGAIKSGASRQQSSVNSTNFMDLQTLLKPEEVVQAPDTMNVRFIEPFWSTIKMREQLICYPGSANIMPSMGQARIKDVVALLNNQCIHLVHSLLVDLHFERVMRYQLKVLENLNMTEGKTAVLHLGDIGQSLKHPKQRQIRPETEEEKVQFEDFCGRYDKMVEQLNDFPQSVLIYLLIIAQINRFVVTHLKVLNIVLRKSDQSSSPDVQVCRDRQDPSWTLFLKGIGTLPLGEPLEVEGQLRLDEVLNLLNLNGEARTDMLCAIGLMAHYHFVQYHLLQGLMDDKKIPQDELGKTLSFSPNPVTTIQLWFPMVTIVGYQGNLSLYSEWPEDLICSGTEHLQDFRRHFSNKSVVQDLESRLLTSFQLYLSELISSEKICLSARLRCVSVEEYNQNQRVYQYQTISSKFGNKNLSVFRNLIRDLAIMGKTGMSRTSLSLPPALTVSSEHLHLVSTEIKKHAEFKCLLNIMVTAKDEISLMRTEITEVKNAVSTMYEEFKSKIDEAIFGNTTVLQTDVTHLRKDVERLVNQISVAGLATSGQDSGTNSGAGPSNDDNRVEDRRQEERREETSRKVQKLKLRCEKKE